MAEYLQQPSVFSTTRRYSSLELTFLQNLLGIVFAVLVSPFIELSEGRDMAAWKKDFYDGWLCLRNQEGLQSSARTDCSAAAWSLTSFFPFMVSYSLMINIVPRYCGATPLFLLAALCLPVQNLLLSSSMVMGKYKSDPLVWYNICGLVCIMFFEIIYANEMRKAAAKEDSASMKKIDNDSVTRIEIGSAGRNIYKSQKCPWILLQPIKPALVILCLFLITIYFYIIP